MVKVRAKIMSVGLMGAAMMLPLNAAKADQVGHASWYALTSQTASGERMNPNELTAAHRSLPFGTKVLVENLNNGRSVVVRINDRGPFIGGRVIDLSKAAAAQIGMLQSGHRQGADHPGQRRRSRGPGQEVGCHHKAMWRDHQAAPLIRKPLRQFGFGTLTGADLKDRKRRAESPAFPFSPVFPHHPAERRTPPPHQDPHRAARTLATVARMR